jgi:hypothetical protein
MMFPTMSARPTLRGSADFPARWGSTVPNFAFYGKSNIVEVVVPSWIKTIGDFAFANCKGLRVVNLPDGLEKIGDVSFANCTNLVEIKLPRTLHTIGDGAFAGCTGLQELDLASVHTISSASTAVNGTFEGCTNLRTLILPSTLKVLGATAFKDSTAKLQMLVVAPVLPTTVETGFAATVSGAQLVCAPDAVVAAMGGAFSDMNTMADVRNARCAVRLRDHHYWTIQTHRHRVCTPRQRLCAYTVILVGIRLKSRNNILGELPAMPHEMWIEVLGLVRRDSWT